MRIRASLAAAVLAATVAAHAGGATGTASPSPYGAWKARITSEYLLDFGMVDPRFPGTWRMVLSKGRYRLYNPLDGWSTGSLVRVGRTLVISGERGWGCKRFGVDRATYRWTLAAGKLRLSSVTPDPCGGRWQTFTAPVWTRA